MQKVTIKEKEKQSKDIDWTKGYFIDKDKEFVILANRKKALNKDCFSGIVIYKKATAISLVKVGDFDNSWIKDFFRPFEGTITVELE